MLGTTNGGDGRRNKIIHNAFLNCLQMRKYSRVLTERRNLFKFKKPTETRKITGKIVPPSKEDIIDKQ